ncbi:MAG: Peptidoglycan-binding LysM [Frankiales bacterium]|jgi:LysM repeat protein|nr:Peptidoglycan-binding LysM [Frankiales bacterium]
MTPRRASRTLAVLVTLAAVLTAGAPSIIRVKAGDSLWELARRHGTTVAVLRRLNDLPGNGTIYAGELLKVPSRPAARTRTVERSYTVRSGDNLSVIAQRLGVSVSTLRTRNKLPRNGLVTVGRKLAYPVKVGGSSRTSTATHNAGVRIPTRVQQSTAAHRTYLASHRQPSKSQVRTMVAKTARKHGVDPSLALAVAYHESGFQQRVVSPVDAIGVMQVLPSTGRVLGQQYGRRLDLLKAQDNITAGVLLLQQLLRSTGSPARALAGYYQGLGSVAARGLLPQTHAYIKNVSSLRARFRNG